MAFLPYKTNSILLINADTVLILPVAFQAFQSISGRHFKFIDHPNSVDLIQFPTRNRPNRLRTAFSSCLRCYTIKNILGTRRLEGSYHGSYYNGIRYRCQVICKVCIIAVLDEVSTAIHGGGAAVNIKICGLSAAFFCWNQIAPLSFHFLEGPFCPQKPLFKGLLGHKIKPF